MTQIALDVGQTTMKVRTTDGREASYPGVVTNRAVLPQLAEAVARSTADFGPADAVAIGSSGLTKAAADPAELLRLARAAGAQVGRLVLAHDSITSYLGALGSRPGVVVAAGTGSVILGVGATSVQRVDGWGNVMGDAGSAYWMGRAVLDAVMRAFDGRGPATALTDVVVAQFPDLEEAYVAVQSDPHLVSLVASFARAASDRAGTDAVAAEICRAAGHELAVSALAAARAVGLGEAPVVCCIGNVFNGALVREAFAEALRSSAPKAQIAQPLGVGVDGAQALLSLPDGHPLWSRVGQAS